MTNVWLSLRSKKTIFTAQTFWFREKEVIWGVCKNKKMLTNIISKVVCYTSLQKATDVA